MTDRERRALQLFASGDGCCQSVLRAYADVAGLSDRQAAMLAAGFGGGIARMRMNCGASTALVLLAPYLLGPDAHLRERRSDVYALVQQLHNEFRSERGSFICAELLGRPAGPEAPVPGERTAAYYRGRPCAKCILTACRILEKRLG